MLRQRIITAVILFIVIIAALWMGPWAFTAVAAIAMGACLWEWLRLAKWNNALCLLIGFAAAVFFYWLEMFQPIDVNMLQSGNGLLIISSVGTVIWTVITCVVFFKRMSGWNVPNPLAWLSALIFVPCAWFSLMFLYREFGAVYMISVLAIVWVADITAYFGGRALQGPKMATGISPKKTWSGALTAVICVLVLSYVLYAVAPQAPFWTNTIISKLTVFASAVILFITVLFSIAGDLFESAVKRTAGVKDSSNLLPGHGGVYDRLDAQFAVLPLAVFILLFIQGL